MKRTLLKLMAVFALLVGGVCYINAQTVYGLMRTAWTIENPDPATAEEQPMITMTGLSTAHAELSVTDAVTVLIADKRIENYSGILAAAGAGSKFYAFVEYDNDGTSVPCFCAVNFETGDVTRINSTDYGNDDARKAGYDMRGLAYDESTETLYGIEYVYDDNVGSTVTVLYKVDTESGQLTKCKTYDDELVGIAARDGKLYVSNMKITFEGKAPNTTIKTTFSLYELGDDLNMPETPLLEAEGVAGLSYNTNNTLTFATDGKLYMQMNAKTFAIDLDAKTIVLRGEFDKPLYGLTFAKSSENGNGGNDDDEPQDTPVTRLLVRSVRYGDHMGTSAGKDMGKTEYFYSSDNRLSRVVESGRGYDNTNQPTDYEVLYLTKYNYDDNHLLMGTETWQTGLYDFGDKSYALRSTTTYGYDEKGRLTIEPSSPYILYHEYDGNDNIVKTTKKNATSGDIIQVLEYSDFAGKNKPRRIQSTSPAHPEWTSYIYVASCSYDSNGNKTEELRVGGETGNDNMQRETWEYDETFLKEYMLTQFYSDGSEVPYSKTVYEMVDGNPDKVKKSGFTYFDGEWEGSNTYYVDEYQEFKGMNELVVIDGLKAEFVDGELNTVHLSFPAPIVANFGCKFNIFRKGELIDTKAVGDDNLDIEIDADGMPTLSYVDSALYNGDYEYFVQPAVVPYIEELDGEENEAATVGYNISNIAEITLDLDLPAVTNLGYGNQRQDENDVTCVTVSWTNPEYPESYGFISNDLHFVGYQIADAVTDDPEATSLEGEFNSVGTEVFVLTRYKYGKAISDTLKVELKPVGIDAVTDKSGISISLNGRQLSLDGNADIAIYSLAGKMEAKAAGTTGMNLGSLASGTYIICVTKNGSTEAYKMVLK